MFRRREGFEKDSVQSVESRGAGHVPACLKVVKSDGLPLSERSDESLMLAHGSGSEPAFAELVRRHYRPVLNYVFRMVQNRHIAEELTQDVFLALVKNAARYTPTAKFTTYLYTIASNIVKKEWTRRKRRFRLFPILARQGGHGGNGDEYDPVDFAQEPRAGARGLTERDEISAAVNEALKRLPHHQREAFVLRRFLDVPYEEMAKVAGAPVGTMKSRVVRAERALRPFLSEFRDYLRP